MKSILGDLFFQCVWDGHVLVLQCFCRVAGEGASSSLLASLLVWFTWVDLGGIRGRASGSECRTWEGSLVGERVAQTAVIMATQLLFSLHFHFCSLPFSPLASGHSGKPKLCRHWWMGASSPMIYEGKE